MNIAVSANNGSIAFAAFADHHKSRITVELSTRTADKPYCESPFGAHCWATHLITAITDLASSHLPGPPRDVARRASIRPVRGPRRAESRHFTQKTTQSPTTFFFFGLPSLVDVPSVCTCRTNDRLTFPHMPWWTTIV